MAIYTDRLGLRRPELSDVENVQTDIDTNFDIIDEAINGNIYTSSTRPINPFDGKLIYESDTKLLAIFTDLKGWGYVGGSAFAHGKRAIVATDSNSANTTSTEIGPFISASFTSELARRYWVELLCNVSVVGSSASPKVRVRWASGGTVTNTSTQLGSDMLGNVTNGTGSNQDYFKLYSFVPNISGTITVGLFLLGTGTPVFFDGNFNKSQMLLIRDVGQ